MPATENSRRNVQEPTLANPSLPDHDRTKDEGMHAAIPTEMMEDPSTNVGSIQEGDSGSPGALDEAAITPPDQEFEQMISSGSGSNGGQIPEDPNNWLTSDPEQGYADGDPENRGESTADIMEGDRH